MIKLSVIIPIYDTPKELLEHCISSLKDNLRHFFGGAEILCINDGSTEPHIEELLKQAEKEDSRFKYIYKSNSGVSNTRNFGIDMAQGKYLTFVDADDYLEPDALQYMVSTIETVKTDVVGFGFCENDEKDNRIPFRHLYTGAEKEIIIRNNIHYEDAKFRGFIFCMVWAKIYRREFLLQNKLYFVQDISPNEDTFFSISCLQMADRFYVDNRIVYHYVYYENSAIHKFTDRHISIAIKIMPMLESFATSYYPDSKLFRDTLAKRAYWYIRFVKARYFTHPSNTKSFWDLKSEMDDFLSNPNISKWVKKLKLSDAEDVVDFRNRLLLKLHFYWLFLIIERKNRRKTLR